MFKTYFLFEPGEDPFRYTGEAAKAACESISALKGYVQTRALPGQDSPAFSGSAELWFDDLESAVAARDQGIAALMSDAAKIRSSLIGIERTVVRTPAYINADRIKGVYPFCKKPGLSLDEFRHYWWHNHGPIAALTEEALSYVQIHPIESIYDKSKQVFDAITEISWPDLESAHRGLGSRQMSEDQGTDAPNFVDMDSIALFLAQEEIIISP
jgi:hypothetical protein